MEDSLYVLIPLSLLLVFAIGGILWWSVRSGQFDDLEGPGYRVIMDDDDPKVLPPEDAVAAHNETRNSPDQSGP